MHDIHAFDHATENGESAVLHVEVCAVVGEVEKELARRGIRTVPLRHGDRTFEIRASWAEFIVDIRAGRNVRAEIPDLESSALQNKSRNGPMEKRIVEVAAGCGVFDVKQKIPHGERR